MRVYYVCVFKRESARARERERARESARAIERASKRELEIEVAVVLGTGRERDAAGDNLLV
jgi:hypothetical protein